MGIRGVLENLIDSGISLFSPKMGLQRQAYRRSRTLLERQTELLDKRELRSGKLRRRSFKQVAPNDSRDSRFVTEDVEINSLLDETLKDTQMRAVGLYSDNGIARSAVENRVAYEVGAGLRVKPKVKTSKRIKWLTRERVKEINDEISELVSNWSENGVDRARQMSYGQAQRLMVREFANEGECFILLGDVPFDKRGAFAGPSSMAMEFISPRRVETPPEFLNDEDVRLGIRYGSRGEIKGYYVRKKHPDDNLNIHDSSEDFQFFERFDSRGRQKMLHIFEPLFAGQTRGLPWLLAAMNKILDFDDYLEAEIIGKQVEACFGLVFKLAKRDDRHESLYEMANAAAETQTSTSDQLIEKLGPGFIQRLTDDDDVTVIDPDRPGGNFMPFFEASIRMIAAATQQPYELLCKNFFQTTFASGRLALLDGQVSFCMRRSTLEDMGLNPIHARLISTAVWENELYGTLPVEIYTQNPWWFHRRKYCSRPFGQIQPDRENAAYQTALESEFMNYEDIYEDRGGEDWEAAKEQQQTERIRGIDLRLELEEYEMKQRKAKKLPLPTATENGDKKNGKPQNGKPVEPNNRLNFDSLNGNLAGELVSHG